MKMIFGNYISKKMKIMVGDGGKEWSEVKTFEIYWGLKIQIRPCVIK